MKAETVDALVAHIRSIDAQVEALRASVDAEPLPASQRQYLARCCDLLHLELTAARSCLEGLR